MLFPACEASPSELPTTACRPFGKGFFKVVNGVAPLSVVATYGVVGLKVGKVPRLLVLSSIGLKNRPYPPRITVLRDTWYAKPNRGPKLFLSSLPSRAE